MQYRRIKRFAWLTENALRGESKQVQASGTIQGGMLVMSGEGSHMVL